MLAGLVSLAHAQQKPKPSAKAKSAAAQSAFPALWKSQAPSGHQFRVKVENDLFTADWVNVPPASAKLGAYIHTECRRAGEKWIGTSRVLLPCAKPTEVAGKITHACPMTLRFEVNQITPTRIAGRGETLKDFDCEKCEVKLTGWADYVWAPKK